MEHGLGTRNLVIYDGGGTNLCSCVCETMSYNMASIKSISISNKCNECMQSRLRNLPFVISGHKKDTFNTSPESLLMFNTKNYTT